MKNNIHKRVTWEDKFGRKFWVDNKAKRVRIKWQKRYNNKKFRRIKLWEVYNDN